MGYIIKLQTMFTLERIGASLVVLLLSEYVLI